MSVTAFLPLLRGIAYRLVKRMPANIDKADLVQAAALRLLTASGDSDPAGAHGLALASKRAKGAMLDECRSYDTMGRRTRRAVKAVEAAGRALVAEGMRATPSAIAERTGLTVEQVAAVAELLSRRAQDDGLESATADSDFQPELRAERAESAAVLRAAVQRLPAAQREAITARLSGAETHDTARRLGITADALWQRESDGRRSLRRMLRAHFA